MSTVNLGKVSITPGGVFASSAQYQPLTLVNYNGDIYLSTTTVSGVVPGVTNLWNNYWMKIGGKGDTGAGLTIKGYYATLAALQSAVPSPNVGDAYGVGSAGAYNIYTYTSGGAWVNAGPLNAQNAVLYTAQSLSTAQKTQARGNIGAVGSINGVYADNVSITPATIGAVATTVSTATLTGNDATVGTGCFVHKQGRIVSVNVDVTLTADKGTGSTNYFATIPSGYRPLAAFTCILANGLSPLFFAISNTTGNIYPLGGSIPSGNRIRGIVTYISAT